MSFGCRAGVWLFNLGGLGVLSWSFVVLLVVITEFLCFEFVLNVGYACWLDC